MINKYKDFVISIGHIISEEEIEDQFLRLKEVFNCNINCTLYFDNSSGRYMYIIMVNKIKKGCNISIVKDELRQVKYRIEEMFPAKIKCVKLNDDKYFSWQVQIRYVPKETE